LKNYKLSNIAFPKQKQWTSESHALSHVEANIPEPEPVLVPTSSEPIGASEPYLYPAIFRHESKQTSYSAKLRIIPDCKNCYKLCEACPAGSKYTSKIGYSLLGVNHTSALFGCSNIPRSSDYLVKVIFA